MDNLVDGARPGSGMGELGAGKTKGFGELLNDGIHKVNASVKDFEALSDKVSHGERGDIHELMVKGEQADMNLRLMLSLRNKVIEAYQDVMRLTV